MKIAYIENIRFPSERAHSYQIAMTCEGLQSNGADVVLVVPERHDASSKRDVRDFFKNLQPFSIEKLPVIDWLTRVPTFLKRLAYLFERWTFQRSVRTWAMSHRADVWYTRDPWMIPSFYKEGRRVVLELHDASGHKLERIRVLRSHIWKFVVITHGLREELLGIGVADEDILVAPDAYDPRDFEITTEMSTVRSEWGVPETAFVVIYTGSFYPWKNVDFAVRNWKMTPEDCHLVLFGGPQSDFERVRSLVSEYGDDRVHLFPSVPHARVAHQLAGADIGLLPTSPESRIGRSFTSPLKVFEYLAAGLPVLASDVPSSREILTEKTARFFTGEPASFLDALEAVREDGWRRSASKIALDIVRPHTWNARSRKILEWIRI